MLNDLLYVVVYEPLNTFFLTKFIYSSTVYTERGSQTQNPQIKSHIFF